MTIGVEMSQTLTVMLEFEVGEKIVRRHASVTLPTGTTDSDLVGWTIALKTGLSDMIEPNSAEIIKLVDDAHDE